MAAFDLTRLAAVGLHETARFRRGGFLVVERIPLPERTEALRVGICRLGGCGAGRRGHEPSGRATFHPGG